MPNFSPFNPPHGFYIWSVVDEGPIILQLLGRNVKETVLNLANDILQHAYQVERIQHKYLYILAKKRLPIGKLYFAKAGPHRQECLIAKIGKEKLLFHFESRGLFIYVTLHCPRSIKSNLLPHLHHYEEEFASLCLSSIHPSN
ncbi:MAG: hypothetical protein ACTSQI_08065 [Candidatus Helarchaeota archaeon]